MDDRDQLEQWFRAYSQDIYHFLIYYTGRLDVDDLVQEVFIKAYQSMTSFKKYSNPKTWLIAIARNLAIDVARKKRRYRELIPQLFNDMTHQVEGPETWLGNKEAMYEFYQTTCQLKRSYQEVLLCRIQKDYTVSETAEILGWSKAKVNLTYHRALKKLQSIYPLDHEEG